MLDWAAMMRVVGLIAGAAALTALLAVAAGPAAAAAPTVGKPTTSSNWSGYAISDVTTVQNGTTDPVQTPPLSFTSATGTWREPQVRCIAGKPTYSAFWVGLGGFGTTSNALEQTGTGADCTVGGKPTHYAWYELVPDAPVTLPIAIHAGDLITASVNIDGSDVLMQIKNRTRGKSFTRHLKMDQPDLTSAEWIAEAPSNCNQGGQSCSVLPLANFGSVTFSRIAAIGSGHPGTITDTTWAVSHLRLVPDGSGRSFFAPADVSARAGADAAEVTPDGRGFAVAWRPRSAAN